MPFEAKPLRALALTYALTVLSCSGGETEKAPEVASTPPPTTPAAPATRSSRAAPKPAATGKAPTAKPASPPTTTPGDPTTSTASRLEAPPLLEPTPTPEAVPRVDMTRVAELVGEGEAALGESRLAEATARFAEALAVDPGNARARRGKARAATTLLGLNRTFVPEISSADGVEGRVTEMDDFDVAGLDVRRAAHIPGRTEIEAAPRRIKPGETYEVQIYVRNQSRKKKRIIKITDLRIHRIVNGRASRLPASPSVREVPPKERRLVATITGPWEDEVASWILDVEVLSEGNDVYQNRLVWR